MLIATFNDTTGWRGRTITYEGEHFVLQNHGRISPKNVMRYDEKGQLEWAGDGMRAWVGSRATATTTRATERPRPPTIEVNEELKRPRNAVWEATLDAVRDARGLTATSVDRDNGRISVKIGLSGFHWGGNATIVVEEAAPGSCRLSIACVPQGNPLTHWATVEQAQAVRKVVDKLVTSVRRRLDLPPVIDGQIDSGPDTLLVDTDLIAILREPSPHAGKALRYDDGFFIDDHGSVTPSEVRDLHANGALDFPEDRQREVCRLAEHDGGPYQAEKVACTVLGGHGFELEQGQSVSLCFFPDTLPGDSLQIWRDSWFRWIAYDQIAALEIGGPGAQTSGGGFIGGGFGLEGAAVGMLVGTALNLLTTRTKVSTVICVRTLSAELFLHHTIETPEQVRRRMSPVFTALLQIEATRQAAAQPAQQPGADSFVGQLARLSELRAQGALTDEEFAAFKAKLME